MSQRLKEVHGSAGPLWRCISEGKFTRAQAAKKLGLVDVQNITNWLSRGIPARRLSDVADLCGLTTDDYRAQAGLRPHRQGSVATTTMVVSQFEALPEGLRKYVTRKIADLNGYADSLPSFLRTKLDPPLDPDEYMKWEQEILADINNRKLKERV